MNPTFICFYTVGTIYEAEAARLRKSLDRLGLPHDLRPIADRGSWEMNTGFTASFLTQMMEERPGPLVYLDADAVVWQRPTLLEELSPEDFDLALHYRGGKELLNGTLWLGSTTACRKAIRIYKAKCEAQPKFRNEQLFLQQAIEQMGDRLRVNRLPAEYCWIHDIMAKDIEGEPIIEHLQASREMTGSTLLPSRRMRLAEIEGRL